MYNATTDRTAAARHPRNQARMTQITSNILLDSDRREAAGGKQGLEDDSPDSDEEADPERSKGLAEVGPRADTSIDKHAEGDDVRDERDDIESLPEDAFDISDGLSDN
jgi:hypothetical protein